MPFDWWPGIPIALRTGVWPLDVQVLCHANGCPDSLQRVAARQAFWQFTFGDLGHICEEFGCPLNKKQSLIDRLVTLIKFFIPDISDDELLVILEKRLQMPSPHLSLLDMFDDEGLDKILDPDARKILREEKVASAKVIEGDDLIRTYTKTMRLRLHPPPRPVKRRVAGAAQNWPEKDAAGSGGSLEQGGEGGGGEGGGEGGGGGGGGRGFGRDSTAGRVG